MTANARQLLLKLDARAQMRRSQGRMAPKATTKIENIRPLFLRSADFNLRVGRVPIFLGILIKCT